MAGKLTNRDIFEQLVEVVKKNHEVQQGTAETLVNFQAILREIKEENMASCKLLNKRIWTTIYLLIGSVLLLAGIKLGPELLAMLA